MNGSAEALIVGIPLVLIGLVCTALAAVYRRRSARCGSVMDRSSGRDGTHVRASARATRAQQDAGDRDDDADHRDREPEVRKSGELQGQTDGERQHAENDRDRPPAELHTLSVSLRRSASSQ